MDTDWYYTLQDSYFPLYNYVHILQKDVPTRSLTICRKYVGNVVILRIDELETYVIALTAGGMDLSDNIELAYYIIDGTSPVKAAQVMNLSNEAEALLMFCREDACKHGRTCLNNINQFLNKEKECKH